MGVSFTEYIVLEGIAHLSNQEKYPWCVVPRRDLADFYDLSVRGFQKIIERMEKAGFVERNESGHLRTTDLWIDATTEHVGGEQSYTKGVNKVTQGGEQSSTNENRSPEVGGEQSYTNHNHNNNHNNNQPNSLFANAPNEEKKENLPLRGNKEKEKNVEELARELVDYFKEVFGRTGGGVKATMRNLGYWLDEYSVDDIKQAISNAHSDNYWKNILTLDILLRKRRPTVEGQEHEYVDRIGQFIARGEIKSDFTELTDMDIWAVAKLKRVAHRVAVDKARQINELIKNGEYAQKANGQTPKELLIKWIDISISKGFVKHFNEIEEMELEEMHPTKVAARKKLRAYQKALIEKGVL